VEHADLMVVVEKHGKWLREEEGGERADLTGADLTRANLTGANLTGANLTWANLTWANLTGANLTWANLTGANLTWANLTGANLTGANLTGANLTGANLTGARIDGKTIVQVSGIGSERRMTTYFADDDVVVCGCFRGSLESFRVRVMDTHSGNPKHLSNYMAAIALFENAAKFKVVKS
jgi:hypothetical protein